MVSLFWPTLFMLLRKQVNNCELLTVGCCSLRNVLGQLLSVLVGPCCPVLLSCNDADVHTVVLFGK